MRTAIVTGGAKGIGLAITRALVADGMRVLIGGRDEAALAAVSQELGDTVIYAVCDLRNPDDIATLFEQARCELRRLDLLVNNAGLGRFGAFEETSLADWDTIMAVNARGTFLACQHAYRWMQEQGGGRIVNIASVVGYKGYPRQAVYAASKHAMIGLTKVIAAEGQAHGIRAAVISPGGVATEMVSQARPDLDLSTLIQPEDVARAVLYLTNEPDSCCTDFINLRRAGASPFP
jgi:3-oxoacyl-[acyl-carrier protein] reductase